jgi:hypothetical protein
MFIGFSEAELIKDNIKISKKMTQLKFVKIRKVPQLYMEMKLTWANNNKFKESKRVFLRSFNEYVMLDNILNEFKRN